jgi:hypothetical protein
MKKIDFLMIYRFDIHNDHQNNLFHSYHKQVHFYPIYIDEILHIDLHDIKH